jgi:ribosomal-protein-alanine N-acetyltransferase
MTEIQIMQNWHLPSVMEIEKDLFGKEAWSKSVFQSELDLVPDQRMYWVSLEDSKVTGYSGVAVIDDFADVATVAVSKSHQRQGIGAVLFQKILDYAIENHANRILLEVRTNNEVAIEMYKKYGFQIVAERPNYYGPSLDAYVMELVVKDV